MWLFSDVLLNREQCRPSPCWLLVWGLCMQEAGTREAFWSSHGNILSWVSSYLFWQTRELSPAFFLPVSVFLSCLLFHFFPFLHLSFLSPWSFWEECLRQTLAKGLPYKDKAPEKCLLQVRVSPLLSTVMLIPWLLNEIAVPIIITF